MLLKYGFFGFLPKNLLGGLGLRNLICKHAILPNQNIQFSFIISVAFFSIMPERCVVFGCNNTASSEKGISLYRIQFWDDSRQVAKSRRISFSSEVIRKNLKIQIADSAQFVTSLVGYVCLLKTKLGIVSYYSLKLNDALHTDTT